MELKKCKRASDWSAEQVVECIEIFKKNDRVSSENAAMDLEDAFNFRIDVKIFTEELGTVDTDEVLRICLLKVPRREKRSKVIMQWFAIFYEDYVFDEDNATRMGTFTASAALSIDDVLDLIEQLGGEEREAEDEDRFNWIDSIGCESTVATLEAWAHAASFPTGWSTEARSRMNVALMRWSTNWGEAFQGRAARLAMGWLKELLAPLAPLLGECPLLESATELLEVFS